MLNSYKSVNSKTSDQILNIIYKIQNVCYYKDDDEIVCGRYNTTKDQNVRQQPLRSLKKSKTKRNYLYICNTNKSYQNSCNVVTENVDNNVCSCLIKNVADYVCRLHLKFNIKITKLFYFKENFNNIQFVILIFLLALLMTTVHYTAGNINEQKTLTRRRPYFLADESSIADKNFTISVPCYHYTFNTIHIITNTSQEPKSRICHNLHYIYQRHRNGARFFHHIKNPTNYKFNRFKIPSKWLNTYLSFNVKIDSGNANTVPKKYDNDDEYQHQQMQYKNVSNAIDKQVHKLDFNTNAINFEHYLIKMVDKSNHTNSNTLQQRTMNININTNINKTNTSYNNKSNKIRSIKTESETNENKNYTTKDIVNNNDNLPMSVSYPAILNLFQNVNVSSKFSSKEMIKHNESNEYVDYGINLQQKQHINSSIILKLVMDGLGIKKAPNMQTANISQHEYVTKYREYLRRLHIRKRRRLLDNNEEYDENTLRPLDILSIPSTEISIIRQKRDALFDVNGHSLESYRNDEINDYHDDDEGDQKESLMERVKNILLFKKKIQKPRSTKKEKYERKTNLRLMFALKQEILNLSSVDIEDANVRMVLIHSPILAIRNTKYKRTHIKSKNNSCISNERKVKKYPQQINALNLKLYFLSKSGKKIWLDGRKIDINVDLTKPDETHTQWLQFDVSKAVKMVVDEKQLQHVTLELQCDNCKRFGARILNDAYDTAADALTEDSNNQNNKLMPILNIIGRLDKTHRTLKPHKYDNHHNSEVSNSQRHYHHQNYDNSKNRHKNRRTNCYKANQRCCRHSMEVTFKEIKGFEFIIQPKVFDAGYCHGRCPPRYNPANHHAMLQSLIWKQNHKKAPKPCCAPSKLIELEVLHVDEKDSEKLKISTWSDMKVVECACS